MYGEHIPGCPVYGVEMAAKVDTAVTRQLSQTYPIKDDIRLKQDDIRLMINNHIQPIKDDIRLIKDDIVLIKDDIRL